MPLFKPLSLIRVSLQAALSTHINSVMYSQDETIRLADFEKTELFWISLMQLGASALLSRIAFHTEKLRINAKITRVFAPDF